MSKLCLASVSGGSSVSPPFLFTTTLRRCAGVNKASTIIGYIRLGARDNDGHAGSVGVNVPGPNRRLVVPWRALDFAGEGSRMRGWGLVYFLIIEMGLKPARAERSIRKSALSGDRTLFTLSTITRNYSTHILSIMEYVLLGCIKRYHTGYSKGVEDDLSYDCYQESGVKDLR